jgi:hypothetical protein
VPAADVRRYRRADADHGGFGYYRFDVLDRGNDLVGGRAGCEPHRLGHDWGTGSAGRDAGFARHVGIDLRGDPRADRASDTNTDYADHSTGSHRRVLDTDRRPVRRHGHGNPGRHAYVHGDQHSHRGSDRQSDRHGIGARHRQGRDVDWPGRFTRPAD